MAEPIITLVMGKQPQEVPLIMQARPPQDWLLWHMFCELYPYYEAWLDKQEKLKGDKHD